VTTLHGCGGVLRLPLDTLFWALAIYWSRLLACVEVALTTEVDLHKVALSMAKNKAPSSDGVVVVVVVVVVVAFVPVYVLRCHWHRTFFSHDPRGFTSTVYPL
jgi:hypothetical protein